MMIFLIFSMQKMCFTRWYSQSFHCLQ